MSDPSLPPFARFLSQAAACRWSVAAIGVHAVLSATPVGGMPCPLLSLTGVPCPGCGITRASEALASGEWARAFELHALAPVVLALLGLVLTSAVANPATRARLVSAVASVELQRKFTHALAAVVLFYWCDSMACAGLGYADAI